MNCVNLYCAICNNIVSTVAHSENRNNYPISHKLFHVFCKYFLVSMNENEDVNDEEFFCRDCKEWVRNLSFLHEQLESIQSQVNKIVLKLTARLLNECSSSPLMRKEKPESLKRRTRQVLYNRYNPQIVLTNSDVTAAAAAAAFTCRNKYGKQEEQDENLLWNEINLTVHHDPTIDNCSNSSSSSHSLADSPIDNDDDDEPNQSTSEFQDDDDDEWTADPSPCRTSRKRITKVDVQINEGDDDNDDNDDKNNSSSKSKTRRRQFHAKQLEDGKYLYKNCYYETLDGGFKCGKCRAFRTSKYNMNFHITKRHLDKSQQQYEEFLCGPSNFVDDDDGHRFQFEWSSDGFFKCGTCDTTARGRKSIREHINMWHCTGPELCQLCGKSYKNKIILKKHPCGQEQPAPRKLTPYKPRARSVKCDEDKFLFQGRWPYELINVGDGHKKVKCGTCGVVTKKRNSMASHIHKKHAGREEGPFICEQCGRSFEFKQSFEAHLGTHSDVRGFVCEVCGTKFRLRSTLQNHKMCVHEGRTWTCVPCNKTFKSSSGLHFHKKAHGGIKLFECQLCQRKFSYQSNLAVHMKKCTGPAEEAEEMD